MYSLSKLASRMSHSNNKVFLILTSAVFTQVLSSFESPSHELYGNTGAQVLTVCAGDQIVLTCQHNVVSNQASRWTFTPPLSDCTRRVIDHNNHNDVEKCGPFTFHNVTGVDEQPMELSSTAVARVDESMSGILIQCWDSERINANLIGNITLCVIGLQSVVAGKISVYYTANATAEIYWDPLVYEECATNTTETVYEVSVTTQGGGLPEGALNIEDESSAIVSDLQPNQEYSVLVDAIIFIGNNTCFTTKYPPMSLMIPGNHSQTYSGFNIYLWIITPVACVFGIVTITIIFVTITIVCVRRTSIKNKHKSASKGGKSQNLNDRMKRITQQDMNYIDVKLPKKAGRKSVKDFGDDQVMYSTLMFTEKNLEASLARNSMLAEQDITEEDIKQQSFTAYV